ncbi:hypothetical protein Q3G72_034253 [Acer saccharum]|nr:hypothetical protein Q3G72_034253 [Acer saccharum]
MLCAVGLGMLTALYISMAPHTVQGLDAGELVAGAYNRTVVHPPGYPLWVWLMHAATHAVDYGTVFLRASLLNIAFATLVLSCLTLAGRYKIAAFIASCCLALQQTFFTYAVVPDVFMLNGLLFAALCVVYDRWAIGHERTLLLAVLFGLGLANHQTFIATAPMVLQGIFAQRRWRAGVGALAVGLGLCAVLYASLMLMQPRDPRSWGNLQTGADWLRHVLRQEYGTWRLARTAAPVRPWLHWAYMLRLGFGALPMAMLLGCVTPALMLLRAAYRKLMPHRLWWLWASLSLYVLLFFVGVNQTDERVIERFLLMPLIGYSYLAVALYSRLRLPHNRGINALMCSAALLSCAHHVAQDSAARDLSKNTIVEDYAQNLLRMAQLHPPTVLIVDGDTPLGALRYVQHVQHINAHVPVVALTGPAAWQLEHLRQTHPDLVVSNAVGHGLHTSDLMSRFIEPNEPAYSFLCNTTKGLDVSHQQVVYMGLGRRLQMGMGRGVDTESVKAIVLRSTPAHLKPTAHIREDKVLFASYATADFVAGKFSRDSALKKAHFTHALSLVPYCWPAAYELCLLEDAAEDAHCREHFDAQRAQDARYF